MYECSDIEESLRNKWSLRLHLKGAPLKFDEGAIFQLIYNNFKLPEPREVLFPEETPKANRLRLKKDRLENKRKIREEKQFSFYEASTSGKTTQKASRKIKQYTTKKNETKILPNFEKTDESESEEKPVVVIEISDESDSKEHTEPHRKTGNATFVKNTDVQQHNDQTLQCLMSNNKRENVSANKRNKANKSPTMTGNVPFLKNTKEPRHSKQTLQNIISSNDTEDVATNKISKVAKAKGWKEEKY